MIEKLEKAEEAKRILHVCIILHCSEWLREKMYRILQALCFHHTYDTSGVGKKK